MIVIAVGCDVPTCYARVDRTGVGVRRLRDQATDLFAVAAARGWFVDHLGRAWCPLHRAKEVAA
ncbi:MAG TPA: hypothetical protein VM820_01465 [Vicinamibacterales bacterium]|nr:hypothetical protein [Vicinamibacterales bacterium]